MKLHIRHTTHYTYTEPLRYALQNLCLTPQSGPAQQVLFWDLSAPSTLYPQQDGLGNQVHAYTLVADADSPVRSSWVQAAGQVQTMGVAEFHDAPAMPDPGFFLRPTHLAAPEPALAAFGKTFLTAPASTPKIPELLALTLGISKEISYKKNSTSVTTTALQAFQAGAGVCQDQAHVMVAVCRSLGLPARYVSGYFYAANEPDLASHAWVDVCLDAPSRRWLSLDVTHACPVDQRHVRLAVGTDYNACPPIKGVRQGGGVETMQVEIQIEMV